MQVAALIHGHACDDLLLDTIDSARVNLTDRLLVVFDGAMRTSPDLPVPYLRGCVHGAGRAPYRNVALGLAHLLEAHPEAEWYCYAEYDCLFASPRILHNLAIASERGLWMLGWDGHVDEVRLPLVESLAHVAFATSYYLLGACQFFHGRFLRRLGEMAFFDRLLVATNGAAGGAFPLYGGYDISEHMYPTLARQLGGAIGVFATYDYVESKWHGAHRCFPVRWRPELDPEAEDFPEASILHPLKSFDHPIRQRHRIRRQDAIRPAPYDSSRP